MSCRVMWNGCSINAQYSITSSVPVYELTQYFVLLLQRGPLSLVSTTEELTE
jgi:hypothetical protein